MKFTLIDVPMVYNLVTKQKSPLPVPKPRRVLSIQKFRKNFFIIKHVKIPQSVLPDLVIQPTGSTPTLVQQHLHIKTDRESTPSFSTTQSFSKILTFSRSVNTCTLAISSKVLKRSHDFYIRSRKKIHIKMIPCLHSTEVTL